MVVGLVEIVAAEESLVVELQLELAVAVGTFAVMVVENLLDFVDSVAAEESFVPEVKALED